MCEGGAVILLLLSENWASANERARMVHFGTIMTTIRLLFPAEIAHYYDTTNNKRWVGIFVVYKRNTRKLFSSS